MKVFKFPEDKITKPRWWMKIRNIDKVQTLNRILSFFILLVGVIIVIFVVYKMNQ